MLLKNKNSYKGTFLNNLKHDNNGHEQTPTYKYTGSFRFGLFEGNGTYTDKISGDVYNGTFEKGKREGYGILQKDNIKYKGEFKNNMRNGLVMEVD